MLGRYGFRDVRAAYRNLMALAEETISLPFDAPLPAFSGVDRPAAARGHRRTRPIPTPRW